MKASKEYLNIIYILWWHIGNKILVAYYHNLSQIWRSDKSQTLLFLFVSHQDNILHSIDISAPSPAFPEDYHITYH